MTRPTMANTLNRLIIGSCPQWQEQKYAFITRVTKQYAPLVEKNRHGATNAVTEVQFLHGVQGESPNRSVVVGDQPRSGETSLPSTKTRTRRLDLAATLGFNPEGS